MTVPTTWWVVFGWLAGWLLAARPARLAAAADDQFAGRVSVVVPARNEEDRLPRLLAALAADPPDEVIVVDDGSSDATAVVAAAAGATVIATEPPAGWTGKSYACFAGAEAATGDVVVFLDADTEPAPGFVCRLAARAAATDGLVSVQPWHRVERAYEHLSAVANLAAVMGAGTGRRAVGFGPAMAVPRQLYLAAGGHAVAAGAVAEDLELARSFARAGMPVFAYADGGASGGIRFRMYPSGVRQLVEGWTKNLAAGAGAVAWWRSLLVALWVAAGLRAIAGGWWAYAAFGVQQAWLLRRVGGFRPALAVVWPVPLVAFVGLFLRSATARLFRRQVGWRGRRVAA